MEEKECGNEIAVIDFLREPTALAQVFIQSKMFPDVEVAAQAMVKIIAGREFGLTPLQSMTDLYIVKGKVSLNSKIIASLIKRSGKYDYKIVELTDEVCTLEFFELETDAESGIIKKVSIGKSSFTIKDAARAGIVNKEVWKNWPKNMLFARAVSMGGRTFCPDVITAYSPDEVEDLEPTPPATKTISITASGEVVSGTETTVS